MVKERELDPIELLRRVEIFRLLEDEQLRQLRVLLRQQHFQAGESIFLQGDPGDCLYIILDGYVRIYLLSLDGREVTFRVYGSGEAFGEFAVLDGKPRSADARVAEDARLAVLSREHFLSFVSSNPNVALEMLTALTNRLRHTDELLRHTATRNVNVEEAAQLTLADRAADLIAEFGGSWKFILAAVLLVNVWVWINMWLFWIGKISFDPYPFLLMSTAINVLSILQAPIILMSQNRQSHKDRLRAEIDYQVNLKNELALNEILEHLKALEHKYREQRVDEYDVTKVE